VASVSCAGAPSSNGARDADGPPDAAVQVAAPSPGKDFVCNQVIGLRATEQWYAAGFEDDGVDGAHWQAKTQLGAYIEKWADPANAVWDQPLTSPCTTGADNPDRVIFVAFSPPTMTEPQWEDLLTKDLATIRAKYSAVKEIDVMSMVRSPGNQPCPGNTDPLVMIYPYIDQAIAAAVERAGPIARVGPQIALASCDDFSLNDTDFTPAAAAAVARQMAAAFGP
jgi:hypothetical protein